MPWVQRLQRPLSAATALPGCGQFASDPHTCHNPVGRCRCAQTPSLAPSQYPSWTVQPLRLPLLASWPSSCCGHRQGLASQVCTHLLSTAVIFVLAFKVFCATAAAPLGPEALIPPLELGVLFC